MALLNHFQVVTPRGTQMPIERCGQRTFADDNYVYLLGGFCPDSFHTWSDAWRFNRLTQTWQQCTLADPASPLPDMLAGFSLVSRGPGPDCNCGSNEAFIFGGTKFDEQTNTYIYTNSFYWIKIDKSGRVHLKLQTMLGNVQLPAQCGQGMCRTLEMNQGRLQEVVYIVGGSTGLERNMDVWKLQRPADAPLDQSWNMTRLNRDNPDLDQAHLELFAHDNKLYTFGGFLYGLNDGIPPNQLTIFDLKSNEFEQLQMKPDPVHGFPPTRNGQKMVHRRNMVYLLGGRDLENIFSMVWRFDLDSLEWTQLPTSLPVPVYFISAAISPDGCIFVSGGITTRPLQTNEDDRCVVNCLQKMWLLPPSLVHFAADQLLKGMTEWQLKELTEECLRLADVPQVASHVLCPRKKPSLFATFMDWIRSLLRF